ncbi:MAG: endo alpha-1,4 polygalactosaminidase [Anaerolineales bacterium]
MTRKTFRTRCPYPFLIVALFLAVLAGCSQGGDLTHPVTLFTPNEVIKARTTTRPSQTTVSPGEEIGLAAVKHWLFLLDSDLDEDLLQQIAASSYDMVVLDYIPSEIDREDFPVAQVIERLHDASHPKLVLAYIDIAEAESFRTYWNDDWRIGDPDWILGDDPDGWADDFPVAFWHDEWQSIWMGEDGLLRQILDMGYDGVYLDWVAAYEDELVTEAALRAGVDARSEMIAWVGSISETIRQACARCVIVAQNPADLVADEEFRRSIDAVAQEHVWFDGGVDNRPQGDCPLPRTADEIDTRAYRESLSTACRRQYDDYPDGTLHGSSEEYLEELSFARSQGLVVFSVDYALEVENIIWILQTSRSYGFVPFVGARALDRYIEIVE